MKLTMLKPLATTSTTRLKKSLPSENQESHQTSTSVPTESVTFSGKSEGRKNLATTVLRGLGLAAGLAAAAAGGVAGAVGAAVGAVVGAGAGLVVNAAKNFDLYSSKDLKLGQGAMSGAAVGAAIGGGIGVAGGLGAVGLLGGVGAVAAGGVALGVASLLDNLYTK